MKYRRLVRYVVILSCVAVGVLAYLQRRAALEQARIILADQLSAFVGERVTIDHIDLDVLGLAIRATGVRVDPYKVDAGGPLLQVEELSAQLASFPSRQHLHLTSVVIRRPQVRLELSDGRLVHFPGIQKLLDEPPKDEKTPSPRIDLDELQVEGAVIHAEDLARGWSVDLQGLGGSLAVLDGKPGAVTLQLEQAELVKDDLRESVLSLQATADLAAVPARLQELYLKTADVEVRADGTGYLEDPPAGAPRADLMVRAAADLSAINRFMADAPPLKGQVEVVGSVQYDESFHASGDVSFSGVQVDDYRIGEGTVRYDATPTRIRFEEADLPRGDGSVVARGELGLGERLTLKAQADIRDMELAELFEDLNLKDPWVMTRVSGEAEIEGTLEKPFRLTGHADLVAKSFGVWSESFHRRSPANHILSIRQGAIAADVKIDKDRVQILNGSLVTDRSRLFLDGYIALDESLDLRFDAVDLDVSEVSPLAGLIMTGRGWGKGRIVGPFTKLLITADASLFGARFDDFYLGDLEGRFVAPLDSSSYLDRLRRRVASATSGGGAGVGAKPADPGVAAAVASSAVDNGEDKSSAPGQAATPDAGATTASAARAVIEDGFEVETAQSMLSALDALDQQYYDNRMRRASPAMLLMPELRTRVGRTRARGQVAVVFMDPITMYLDVTLPPGTAERPPDGRIADLMRVYDFQFEGDPIDGEVVGGMEVMGPPDALEGLGELELTNTALYGQHVSSGTARIRMVRGDLLIDSLDATTGQGEMALSGRIGSDLSLDVTALLEHLPFSEVDALAGSGLAATADGVITVQGSYDAPQVQGQVALVGMSLDAKPLGDTLLTLSTTEDILRIQGLLLGDRGRIEADVGLNRQVPYDARLNVSSMPLEPYLALDVEQKAEPWSGETETQQIGRTTEELRTRVLVGGQAHASGMLNGEAPLQLDIDLNELSIARGALSLANAMPVRLELQGGRYRVSPTLFKGDGTTLTIEGGIDPDGDVDLLLGGNFNASLLDAIVPGIFQRIEGQLTLAGLPNSPEQQRFHVGGTVSALRFEGSARLTGGAVRTIWFPPTIDEMTASITVSDGNQITISKLTGSLGGGAVTGGGVLILGPDYYPRHYDLHLDGKDAFIQYPNFLPPGLMNASLRFNGDVGNLLMSGDVWLQRMVYRYRYNWEKILTDFRTYRLESLEAPVTSDPYFNIDINIHAPGTFYIRNNVGDVQLKGELQLVGNTNALELRGEIESVRGTLVILDNNFELTQSRFEFTGDYWNPTLDVRMQTQIQSYTIYYEVTGTLQNWKLTPGSDAGLSERDINSLIAFRTLADNITEGQEARAVLQPAAEFLAGRLGILEQLQAFTRLDRFVFSPATDQSGNIGARVYGEKELVQNRLYVSGFYDYALNGNQEFLTDLEWRAFNCCSLIFRLDNSGQSTSPTAVSPGARLKLKLEFE